MAILANKQKIDKYEVTRLIKENNYCETYRFDDENGNPFFLKLFIIKNTPEKMIDDDGQVRSIAFLSKLRHKNIISFISSGSFDTESVGKCQYVITNYFHGELLADKCTREGKLPQELAIKKFSRYIPWIMRMTEKELL